jgi:PIN domain nuclease of toxin-antitoxin system
VLDASAVLAVVFREPGMQRVDQAIRDGAVILSVNLAEVITRLVDRGFDRIDIRQLLDAMTLTVVPFDEDLAYRAGLLRLVTRSAGLSLGDRACLALAEQLGQPALTADRAWGTVQISIQVDVIR